MKHVAPERATCPNCRVNIPDEIYNKYELPPPPREQEIESTVDGVFGGLGQHIAWK